MNIRKNDVDISGNVINSGIKKEAIINDKYQDIKRIEVTDVIIPRFIPNKIIGSNFDGATLVRDPSDNTIYNVSCYPGIIQTLGVGYIKLTNQKESIILTDISSSVGFSAEDSTFRYKDLKMIDHITINDIPYPIMSINKNRISLVTDFDNELPSQTKLILGNYYSNLIYYTESTILDVSVSGFTIQDTSITIFENIYASNILKIQNPSDGISYFQVTSYKQINDNDVRFNGKFLYSEGGAPYDDAMGAGMKNFYSFGFGTRDLLDDRIFYLELDPFTPVKSSATDNQLDKMFGVLFPSTQSKEWLYLSGEPKESFLPRNLRKLDKITIRIYDSDGNALNDLFNNKAGLLNPFYFKNMYTTVVIKVDEIDKSLVAKK